MILNAIIHGKYEYAEDWAQMAALIEEVMNNLRSERKGSPWVDAGEAATFMFAKNRHSASERTWWPDNMLQVSVNSSTGFGGLIWHASQSRIIEGSASEFIWISNNPAPPSFDPRVVCDSSIPTFFDVRSVLPLALVRSALEEFCRSATGDRPNCVEWVRGELDGERYE